MVQSSHSNQPKEHTMTTILIVSSYAIFAILSLLMVVIVFGFIAMLVDVKFMNRLKPNWNRIIPVTIVWSLSFVLFLHVYQ